MTRQVALIGDPLKRRHSAVMHNAAFAAPRHLQVYNALEMLVCQGEIAFERWAGIGSTAEIMRDDLEAWMTTSEQER